MSRTSARCRAGWLLVGLCVAPALWAQAPATTPDQLIQQASLDGERYAATGDKHARDAAKSGLDRAERLLRDAWRRDNACEACAAGLVAAAFYRAAFGLGKDYEAVVAMAADGLERFPASSRLAYYKGYAHYNRGEYGDAVRALARFAMSPAADLKLLDAATPIRQDAQTRFLGGWWKQADFYASKDARIERINTTTLKRETVFEFNAQWELNTGAQALAEITKAAKPLQDADTQGYLEKIVARLVERSPGPQFPYKVTVIDSPDVNAVTPPGHVIVFSGLLRFVEREGQLAAVLAHELAHNYAHHAARRTLKMQQGQSIAGTILKAVDPQSDMGKAIGVLTAKLGLGLFLNAYSRMDEKEADLYAAHILFNGGFNPTELSGLFTRMYEEDPHQPIKFLSTHPPMPERIVYLTDYLEAFPLAMETKLTSEPFTKLKARYASSPARAHAAGASREGRPAALPPRSTTEPAPAVPAPRPAPTTPPAATPPAAAPPATPPATSAPPVSPPPAGTPPTTAPVVPAARPADDVIRSGELPPLPAQTGLLPPPAPPLPGAPVTSPPAERRPAPAPSQPVVEALPIDLVPAGLIIGGDRACAGFSGRWLTEVGVLVLSVTGDEVRGTYPHGTLEGRIAAGVLTGTWQATAGGDPAAVASGRVEAALQPDGTTTGTWTTLQPVAAAARLSGRCLAARLP